MQVKAAKLFLVGSSAVIGLVLAGVMTFFSAIEPACNVTELWSIPSPNGQLVSSVLQKDCGATTGFVRMVALRHAGEAVGGDDAQTVLTIDRSEQLELQWESDTKLLIRVGPSARVFKRSPSWGNVAIIVEYIRKT